MKKNKDEIFIPFERSPKVIITTNYVINGSGNSHDRRRHEIEFNQYFNGKHTPLDEYGRLLFDEWNNKDWISFDNYMIDNLQRFLINGGNQSYHTTPFQGRNITPRHSQKKTILMFLALLSEQCE